MTTVVIPATSRTVCDACGVVCTMMNRRHSAALHLKRDGLDHSGTPVGDASFRADLCDVCLGNVEKALNTVLKGGVA